jgi:tetratricopeptide (TPR) repeat protein
LLDAGGSVWITDFGVAKALETGDASRTGDITGTLRYMAPERFEGRTDARSDIYSLGLTLFELLTRRPAFEGKDQSSLIRTITQQVLPQPRRIDPEIPRDLETIVLKAAARDPERRYRTAGELAADLTCYLENRPIKARRTTAVEHLWLWCRRNPLPASLSAAVLLLLCLVAVTAGIGYIQTRNANIETNMALDGEKKQRKRAEAVSALAREVLDGIYSRFAARRTAGQPDFTFEDSQGDTITIPVRTVLSTETAALLEDLLVFYDLLAEQDAGNSELRRETARAHRRVGTIQQYLCHFDLAEAAYRKALAICTELRDSGDEASTLEIAEIHNSLGGVFRAFSRIDEAFDEHFAALGLLEEAASDSPSPAVRFELARTNYFLGTRPNLDPGPGPRGQGPGSPPPPPQAGSMRWDPRDYLDKAAAILEDLRGAYPASPEYAHLLACCYRDRSHLLESKREAHESRAEAAAILAQLAREFPGSPDYRHDLSETYAAWDVRGLPYDLLAAAEEDLRRALAILDDLMAEYPNVPTYAMSCVHIHHKLAGLLQRTGRTELAQESLRRAVELQSALVRLFPDLDDHKLWLAEIRKSLARILLDEDRLPESRRLLESVIADLKPLLKDDDPPGRFRGSLIDAYVKLADVFLRSGDDPDARQAYELAEKLRRDDHEFPANVK